VNSVSDEESDEDDVVIGSSEHSIRHSHTTSKSGKTRPPVWSLIVYLFIDPTY